MTPIETINAEMQKHPNDPNIEKVGHYLIDLNLESIPEGKTIVGCVEYMGAKAAKMAFQYGKYKMAAPDDATGYAWINEYYGIKDDAAAGSQQVTGKLPASESPAIDLADFF